MTAVHRLASALVIVGVAIAGCSRAGTKTGDSAAVDTVAAVVAPDSAGASTSAAIPDTAPSRPDTAGRLVPPGSTTPMATPRPAPSEDVLTGKVVAGGLAATPETSLQIEGRGPMKLVGPLEPELRRLGGATVWVAGAPATGEPNASFTVTRYDIVAIDGAKPSVGTLVPRDGSLWLAGIDTVKLRAVPAALQAKPGAKVWIVGRRDGAELVVQSYGIIREP